MVAMASIKGNVWLDIIAIILAVLALVWIAKTYEKSSKVGISLIISVVVILVFAVIYDIKKGTIPLSQFKLTHEGISVVFNKMEAQIQLLCPQGEKFTERKYKCKDCYADYAFSRDWKEPVCSAILELQQDISKLSESENDSDFYFFKKIEAFRKRKIENVEFKVDRIERSEEGSEKQNLIEDLKISIAEVLIFDRLLINSIEEIICEN